MWMCDRGWKVVERAFLRECMDGSVVMSGWMHASMNATGM